MYAIEHGSALGSWQYRSKSTLRLNLGRLCLIFWVSMMNKSDLVELKYLSEASDGINIWGLTEIVKISVASNESHEITGILFFDQGYFGQILEGPRGEVEEVWGRIKNDTRHHNIELLGIVEIEERRFPKWSMKLFNVEEFTEAFPQFSELIRQMVDPEAEKLRIMKLLWQKI